jgi:hypothetical protein
MGGKKLLICSSSKVVTNAFFTQTHAFARLAKDHQVFVCFNDSPQGGSQASDFAGEGFVKAVGISPTERRKRIFLYQLHANTLGARRYSENCGVIYQMNARDYGNPIQRLIHRILGCTEWSAKAFSFLVEAYCGINEGIAAAMAEIKPDLVITFFSGNAPFEIATIKAAKAAGIPTLSLQHGWDQIDTRGFAPFLPDYAGVWGYQSSLTLQRMHKMPPERIFHVGAPFKELFDAAGDADKKAIRSEIGVPMADKLVLFAGTGNAFNEVRLLRLFEEAIATGQLPGATVLYRPHPALVYNTLDLDFFEQGFKHVIMDPAMAPLYSSAHKERKSGGPQRYIQALVPGYLAKLIAACDAVVAPLSTVQIQAACKGVPSVGIAFVDKTNRRYRNRYRFEEHKISRGMPGMFMCSHPRDLISKAAEALSFSASPSNRDLLRHYSGFAIQSDALTYSQRLDRAISSILADRAADRLPFHFLSDPILDFSDDENVVDLEPR